MSKLNKRKLARILLILFMLLAVVAFYFVPGVRSKVTQVLMLFRSMSVESIVGYLRSFGIWAVVISFLLMMFQSIIAPLPAFLITFANAAVFGWWQGERLNKNFSLESLDAYFDRYGKHTILICRLLPFISFDFVSYAAGLTAIKPIPFLIATGIGQLPATVVYSYVGSNLTGSTKTILFGLLSMFALFIAVYVFKQIYQGRQAKTNK